MIRPVASTASLLSVTHGFSHVSHRNMSHVAPLHGGINILLGGVMMGGMLVVVFCICYCCHKRVQKAELQTDSSEQWLHNSEESDSMMQVFTLDGQQQCYEIEGVFVDEPTPQPSPPPSYQAVMKQQKKDDSGLPTYEAAMRLETQSNQVCTIYMDQLTYI
ncbi:uncharacterized protein LOC129005213 [Macrosteles quadrilineatus]|uniref:uncharacterized protein LOC129005213 n=1 Tax=Macrosteles quadrilineatus TaxID=74068 RepID=UPI0023E158A6|nr:uncharacterized protein LOC129005213 [Macrosteles quadrilineatus]